jgi:hypothetical protein
MERKRPNIGMRRNRLLTVLIPIFLLFPQNLQQQSQQQDKLTRWDGKPSSLGIDVYVESNQDLFLRDFKKLVKDSLYADIWFITKNFKKTTPKELYDPFVLAYNESSGSGSCEIVVNNEERFSGFDYKNDNHKEVWGQGDCFVKPTVLHEIMHSYFNQSILEARMYDTVNAVNQYYSQNIFTFPNVELQFGAKFIEEGICEYFIQANGECPPLIEYYIPQREADLRNRANRYDILYDYSSKYLQDFMRFNTMKYGGIKYAIMILLKNRPPDYQEILNPDMFYKRLVF